MRDKYDVIVVGAGHAGCEAALAAAKLGSATLIITSSWDAVAVFACNPSVGGPGRGQLVMEIDALGGAMGLAADTAVINGRTTGGGPASRATLSLLDKNEYSRYQRERLERAAGLDIYQDMVAKIGRYHGGLKVTTRLGVEFKAGAAILTTGTFLNGQVSIGGTSLPGGRYAEIPSNELVKSLTGCGLQFKQFRTGTSPRIDSGTVDVSAFIERQPTLTPLGFVNWRRVDSGRQLSYYEGHTTKGTHAAVAAASLQDDVGFSGQSPRHCPSIAAKVRLFPLRESHKIFIQPTGIDSGEHYIQGMSMSFDPDVQSRIIATIPGLEDAKIIRPGYAVAYDYLVPDQLKPTLETKLIPGLFTAGQINGTSGYEEAAAQGVIAGINAAQKVKGREPFILDRSQAYIGVLIDDLVTKGVDEPYRMFTSRAEYRLILRSDNADLRLTPLAHALGLVGDERLRRVEAKREIRDGDSTAPVDFTQHWEAERLYKALAKRTANRLAKIREAGVLPLPPDIDYLKLSSLSRSARERLQVERPVNLAEAKRYAEVRAGDYEVLALIAERHSRINIVPDEGSVSRETEA